MSMLQRWWGVADQIWFLDLPGTCAPEQEKIFNGGLRDNAQSWNVGTNWAYQAGALKHSAGSTQPISQIGSLVEDGLYKVSLSITGSTGNVVVALDDGDTHQFNAGDGDVSFLGVWNNATTKKIIITPSSGFDGTISNVSVRGLKSDCD